MTLTEFLLARIADGEVEARGLLRRAQEHELDCGEPQLLGKRIPGWYDWPKVQAAAARAIAECEAKRRIVELCRPKFAILYRESERLLASAFDQETMKVEGSSGPIWPDGRAEEILQSLAAVYADHPDYQPEWGID